MEGKRKEKVNERANQYWDNVCLMPISLFFPPFPCDGERIEPNAFLSSSISSLSPSLIPGSNGWISWGTGTNFSPLFGREQFLEAIELRSETRNS